VKYCVASLFDTRPPLVRGIGDHKNDGNQKGEQESKVEEDLLQALRLIWEVTESLDQSRRAYHAAD
jgi:mRNA-degrading endonuclease YafQ of YafQ-DinJ toxin-antitoxin module